MENRDAETKAPPISLASSDQPQTGEPRRKTNEIRNPAVRATSTPAAAESGMTFTNSGWRVQAQMPERIGTSAADRARRSGGFVLFSKASMTNFAVVPAIPTAIPKTMKG